VGKSVKKKILNILREKTQERLSKARESYQSALAHSRSDDMKSEGKYDTRGIEAGYLTSAAKARVKELEKELLQLEALKIKPNKKPTLGSLILLEFGGAQQWHFLSPTYGGSSLEVDGKSVLIISPSSPIGSEALGLEEGDSFEIDTPKMTREYQILQIL
jgi:transcription elongation GreA/GreB family factor